MTASWLVVFRILYRLLTALTRLAVQSGRSKDLEIIVLRHQLQVLRRQVERPAICDSDRNAARRRRRNTPLPAQRGLDRHTRNVAAMAPSTSRPPLDCTDYR